VGRNPKEGGKRKGGLKIRMLIDALATVGKIVKIQQPKFIFLLPLKETVSGKFREIPYDKGHVNFNEAIIIAYQMGVRILLAELWHVGNEDWREQLKYAKN
jgi:L-ribulose-5-phosphate 3-epimerase UlaE